VVATGTLIDDGGHALVPAGALGGATAAWVRDGLGRIASARVVRRIEPLELALLRLEAPLPAAGEVVLHERDAFPGTPAYAVEYASRDGDEAAPAWPWLRTGFLGMPDGVGGLRRLGVQMPPGPRGGPVFDTGGRLVGISVPGDRLVVASLLRAHLGKLVDAVPASAASRVPLDAVYENAMRVAVQVVVAAP